jgi:RHS repeat-associated protein
VARRLAHREYTYRADGHVTSVDDMVGGLRTFDLDPLGRVVAVHGNTWSERYAYDTVGNVVDADWSGPATDGQGSREVSGTLVRRAGRTRFVYDDQKRVIRYSRKTLSGKTKMWSYAWDSDDRLTDVTTPTGEHWHYVYDPVGRRTEKRKLAEGRIGPVEKIEFTWDGYRLAEQSTDIGAITTWDYEPGTHRPLAQTDTAHADQDEAGRRFSAVVTDLVGTPTELVTSAGGITWQSRTTVWGVAVSAAGDADCPIRFPGQYYDAETDSNYNLFRYYLPDSASYQSADPLGFAASPRDHGYVVNPLTACDPLGLIHCGVGSGDEPIDPRFIVDNWDTGDQRDHDADDGYETTEDRERQNKEARDAIVVVQGEIRRQLTPAEVERVHHAITGQGWGYQRILREVRYMFGGSG